MGDVVYVGSCSGFFYALDRQTGAELWVFDADGKSFHGDPVILDEAIIFDTDEQGSDGCSGHIWALEKDAPRSRWKYEATGQASLGCGVTTDLASQGSYLAGVTTEDRLVCLDAQSGQVLWEFTSEFDGSEGYFRLV